MIRLALIRHGHTDWNRAGRIQGRSDIPLDDDARQGLAELTLPTPWNTARLWSSPLERAVETARLIDGRAPDTAPQLTEMNWGDWEGQRGVDLLVQDDSGFRHIEDWGWDYQPPNGESPRQVWNRLRPWLETRAEDAVLVCHIGVMRVILARAMGWDFSGPPPFQVKRNRLYVVQVDGNTLRAEPPPIRLPDRGSAR